MNLCVQVPLMLRLGVDPRVASATSSTMILYTSFTALTSFYVFGLIIYDYALVGFVVGVLVTVIGQVTTRRRHSEFQSCTDFFVRTLADAMLLYVQVGLTMLIKKLGRDSLIVFCVAAVVGVSAILMGTHSFISMAESEIDLSFGTLCGEDR